MSNNAVVRPWMILLLVGFGAVDYALAPYLWVASGLTLLQALLLPVSGVALWRGLRGRARGVALALYVTVLAASSLVLLAKLELPLAGETVPPAPSKLTDESPEQAATTGEVAMDRTRVR